MRLLQAEVQRARNGSQTSELQALLLSQLRPNLYDQGPRGQYSFHSFHSKQYFIFMIIYKIEYYRLALYIVL